MPDDPVTLLEDLACRIASRTPPGVTREEAWRLVALVERVIAERPDYLSGFDRATQDLFRTASAAPLRAFTSIHVH